jgi:uncharacterized protein
MAARLAGQTSPYLLQHADNPVDWWPWCDEAFASARERDVPVLLSVGYSACHWCHVMAHESFEDDQTAAIMNENLVSIKVDREERPDVDSVYMTATQAMTGQGGWPMTVFMTPDREPFFCGTYFPRSQFQRLVLSVARAWREDRTEVAGQASQIAAALAERATESQAADSAPAGPGLGDLAGACDAAVGRLAADYDERRGGFGGAPKFPPSMVLEFLLRHAERLPGGDARARALAMASGTADAMARGGIYDQLAGGFARYSVDADWVVPHFEKMLYDNALLARVYAHLWRRSGNALARRVTEETCGWMLRELGTPEGGFAAALDADSAVSGGRPPESPRASHSNVSGGRPPESPRASHSNGAEGAFYVWTPDELTAVLGPADGAFAAETFGVTSSGTFEHGQSVLQLRADPADQGRLDRIRASLLSAREQRARPGRDDKVVAAWNGLAIAALAEAGVLLGRDDFVAAAIAAAELVTSLHLTGDRLVRTSRDGVASAAPAVLDDYGCVAEGLIALAGVTGAGGWLETAGLLLDTALTRFRASDGTFFDTADDSERLIYRPADVADGPSPSGTFAVAGALLSYSALTGATEQREAAVAALASVPALAGRFPRAVGWGLAVAEAALSGPVEVAIVGPPTPERDALHVAAMTAAPPGAVIALGDGADGAGIPLLAGRGPVDGAAAAYVCRDFACRAPVTDPEQLAAALG